ncbi:MAG: PKD domain-containing protein [Acidimicrobiales bacterium]
MRDFGAPRLAIAGVIGVLALAVLIVVFRLGNQASAGVTLNDPVVWIEHGSQGEVLQVNGSTREITARVRVGERGDSIVAIPRGRDAVFLNRTTGEIGVIGAVSLEVDNVEVLEPASGPMIGEHLELLGNLAVSTNAYVIDDTRTVVVEPGAGLRLPIPTPGGLGDMTIDANGDLLAVTVDGLQIAITSDRGFVPFANLTEPIADSEQAPQLVNTGNTVYVVDPDRRTVNSLEADGTLGPTTCVAGSLSNVRVGSSHASGIEALDRVLVHDPDNRVMSVSEPTRSDCFDIEIDVEGEEYGDPVAIGDFAYLPNWGTGQIVVVDLVERIVVDTHRFGSAGRSFELEVFENAAWVNDPQGPIAGILRGREFQRISKLTRFVVQSGDGEEGDTGAAVVGEGDVDQRFFGDDGEFVGGASSEGEESVGGGEDVSGGSGSPTDRDLAEGDGAPTESVDAQVAVVVDGVQQAQPTVELQANFEFTSDTVNVGEEVGFSDVSTGEPVSWNWAFGDGTGAEGPEVVKSWDLEGVYLVELFVADATGREDSQTVEITVVAVDEIRPPAANFRFRSDTIEVGEVLEFEDLSTGDPETLVWDFGDGTQTTGSLVEHSYSDAGVYTVELTASNGAGSDSTTATITVVAAVVAPEAIIGAFPRTVETGQSITLVSESTNSPTAVSWDFGDRTTALGSEVRHAWADPGTFRIRLFVSNSAGNSSTFADIVVQPRVDPPIARFTESDLVVVSGETLSFSDLSLNNPTRFNWEFGDGSTATGPNVTHRFTEPGTTTVTLTVENEAGRDDVSKTVTVLPPPPDPPTASFTVTNATVPVNTAVVFTDTSTGDPTSWSWNFGDGGSSSAQSPARSFGSPGTYTVTLTASNAGGSDSVSQTIVVIDPPVASFDTAASELAVTFTDTSTGLPTGWSWDFGDGDTSTAQNPTHTYALPGTYTISLIAENAGGASAVFDRTITVAEAPVASFTDTHGGLSVDFIDASSNTPTSWSWDFGDGQTSTTQSPSHAYAAPDTYTVTLTVTNAAGSDSSVRDIDVIATPPVADFTCTVTGGGVACDGTSSTGEVSYDWTAPGATPSSSTVGMPTFLYTTSGTKTITLIVQNAFGDADTFVDTVTISLPPEVTIRNDGYSAGTGSASASSTNGPVAWNWTVNNGGSVTSGQGSDSITYSVPSNGTYRIQVTATNVAGSDSASFQVNVNDLNTPVVNVSGSYDGGASGNASASATVSSSLPILSRTWSINNGGSVTGGQGSNNATFSVPGNGTYVIELVATNAQGSGSDSVTITVNDLNPPTVTISGSYSGGGVATASAIVSSPAGPVTSRVWSITNGGSVSGGQGSNNATFSVPGNGTYTIEMVATNAYGSTTSNPVTITVTDEPIANFTWVQAASPDFTINFTNTSTNAGGATYSWNFGGEGTSSAQNPSFTFSGAGTFLVQLTVTVGSLSDTIAQNVTVNPPVVGP